MRSIFSVQRLALALCCSLSGVASIAPAHAADENPAPPEPLSPVPAMIPALKPPRSFDFTQPLKFAVTTSSEVAQAAVLQGFNHLHGGWDFEAQRHFAVALKEDPDCLMANIGMVISLLSTSPETIAARSSAIDGMLRLVDAKHGSDLERGLAYGIVKYLEEGPEAAATAFRKVSDRYPNDRQSAIFSTLFGRGGYDETGRPTVDQERAEQVLEDLVAADPKDVVALNALLTIRAEAPDVSKFVPDAERLVALQPGYAPYLHLLGHYQWRSGRYLLASTTFGESALLYRGWMQADGITISDCPEWVRTKAYQAVALATGGKFDAGYQLAMTLARTEPDQERPASAGTRMLLWQARTLPARLLLSREKGNPAEAIQTLPTTEEEKPFVKFTLAQWWVLGIKETLLAVQKIDAGDEAGARAKADALATLGTRMTELQAFAAGAGEQSFFNGTFHALEVYSGMLRGRIAALSKSPVTRASAYNWFRTAADRQSPTAMLMPPWLLHPVAAELGDLLVTEKKPDQAVEAYLEALQTFPGNFVVLEKLATAQKAAGHDQESAATTKRLATMRAERDAVKLDSRASGDD